MRSYTFNKTVSLKRGNRLAHLTSVMGLLAAAWFFGMAPQAVSAPVGSNLFDADFRDYSLTVASDYGNPFPPVGTLNYAWRATVTCGVEYVIGDGSTNRLCTGWNGTGSVPSSGVTTNTGPLLLTNLVSSVAWQWQTQFRLTAGTNGCGTVTAGGWFNAGSNATVTAKAVANWHLVSFSGDTNGCSISGNVLTIPMTQARAVAAIFAIDHKTLTVVSAQGGASPGSVTEDYGTALSQWVTNSPAVYGATQYVCAAGAVAGNAYTQVGPTNVTLTLTNTATLTWQWQTQHRLTAGTNGCGTVTAGGWFDAGSNATVTATAASNWHFAGWAGDTNGCAVAGNVLTAPMTQARSVTAVFAVDQMTLTVVSAWGGVKPGTVTTNWGALVSQWVTNSPSVWGSTQYVCAAGAVAGNAYTLVSPTNVTLTLTNSAILTWQWQTQYRLTADTNGCGTVTTGGWWSSGSNATVTATAAWNWHFAGWSGDTNGCSIAGNVLTAPMTQARAVTAIFAVDQKTLTVVSAQGGAKPGTVTTNWGALVSQWVTNSPSVWGATQYVCKAGSVAGNAFTQVSPTNVTVTLTNNATLTWQWQTQHRLTTDTNGNGTVTAGGWLNAGSNATVTATAAANWHFAGWSGDTNGCGIAGDTLTAPMTQARSVTAAFAVDQKTLTVVSGQGGANPGTVTTNWGALVSQWVTNSPAAFGATQYVCAAGAVAGNAYTQVGPTNVTLTLTNNATLTWQWQTQFRMTTGTNGSGTVTAGGWWNAGSNATVTATAAANWHFVGWAGDTNGCAVAGNVLTAPMTQARSVTAVFEVDQETLTVVSTQGGASPGSVTVDYGTALSQWVTNSPVVYGATQHLCAAGAVAGNAYTLVSPTNVTLTLTNNATLTWQWQTLYRLTTGVNGGGTVSTDDWYNSGSNATVTANASANWYFEGWGGDTNGCAFAGNVITAPMTQARTITAKFAPVLYSLSVMNGTGGGSYTNGQCVAITANDPSEGQRFNRWTGDTSAVIEVFASSTTVTMPAADITVAASFVVDQKTLTVVSALGGAQPGTLTADWGTSLGQWVTNSPVANGATQYVCTAGIVAGNAYTQVSPTNVTLTLTNNATLTWQWQTQHLLATGTNGCGMVTTGGWFNSGSNAVLTATAGTGWHFAYWSGETNGCLIATNTLTVPMTRARVVMAVFTLNVKTPTTVYDLKTQFSVTSNPNGTWSYVWNYSPITQKDAYHYGGWGYIPAHDGTIFKCNATGGHDLQPLDVQLHTLSQSSYGGGSTFVGALWTCPQNGYIAVKGRAWDGDFAGGRDAGWTLRAGGDLKAQRGSVYGLYRNSSAAQFANNVASGKSLSGIPVSAGTVVAWHSQTTTPWGHFMGVDLTVAFSTALESSISVESPVGSNLVSGVSALDLGLAAVEHGGIPQTFIVRNSGTKTLNLSGVTTVGGNAGDFNVSTAGMSMAVEPFGSTTFTVMLAPSATGIRTTGLQISSDDPVDGLFNVQLTGEGLPNVDCQLSVASLYGVCNPPVGTGSYLCGSNLTCWVTGVEAVGSTQYVCTGWVGTGNVPMFGGTTNVSFMLTNDSTIAWQWQTQHRLTAGTNGNGTVTAGGWFNAGSNATVTATAAANWHFVSWAGDTNGCGIAGNVLTAPMTQARSVTAVFAVDQETLTVVSAWGGARPGTVTTNWGALVSQWVTNSPAAYGATQYVCAAGSVVGNAFTQVGPTNVTLTLTNNATLTWQWQTQYRLTTGTNGCGMVTAGGWFNSGSNATVTATAAANWHFVSWAGDTNGSAVVGNVLTAPMTQARSVTAVFAVDQETLTVVSAWGGAKPGTVTTNWGSLVSQWVTNSPAAYGATQYVCAAGSVAGNAYTQVGPTNVTLTLTNNATLTWQWQTQHRLTTGTNGNGTVTAGGWFDASSNAAVTATAAANWHFVSWSGDTNGCAIAGNVLTAPMTQARVVTAAFSSDMCSLTVETEHGDAQPVNGTHLYAWGVNVTCQVSHVETGESVQYVCSGWTGTGSLPQVGSAATVAFIITNNSSLVWQWSTNYWVDVAVNGSGSVAGVSGFLPVGSQSTFVATADTGFVFSGWGGDLEGCIANAGVVTVRVDRARTLVAGFRPLPVVGLTAQVVSLNSVHLAWIYGGLAGGTFRVERLVAGGTTWQTLGTVFGTTFADSTVAEGMSLSYRVVAVVGGFDSAAVEVLVEVPYLPAVPTGVGVTAFSSSEVLVSWDAAARADCYLVQRRLLPLGDWSSVASLVSVTSWTDASVVGGLRYVYRLRSVNAAGNSAFSAEVSVAVPTDPGAWTYGMQVSNAAITVSGEPYVSTTNVLCGAQIAGVFDALLSNPDGVHVQHRVVSGLRDTNGVSVGSVVEINELTGIPSQPPVWVTGATVPDGLRVPAVPGTYVLWVEDYLDADDPCAAFADTVNKNETLLTHPVAVFTAVPPGADDAYVRLGSEAERAGKTVDVPITVSAIGGENAFSFSLAYDSSKITFLNIKPGKTAASCYIELNDTTDGELGVLMIMPTDVGLAPGLQELATVKLLIGESVSPGYPITLAFSDNPACRMVVDAYANVLPHAWYDGGVTVAGTSYEADVSPRGKPDDKVDDKDKKQIFRFAAGLDVPEPGSEFQRADCAPVETRGDGRVDACDAVIATRYADGAEPLNGVGGPTERLGAAAASSLGVSGASLLPQNLSGCPERLFALGLAGLIKVDASFGVRGEVISVPVSLVSGGNVEGASFSVRFDPDQLMFLDAIPSAVCSNVMSALNGKGASAGVVGYMMRMPPGRGLPAGSANMLTLFFRVVPAASDTVSTITVAAEPAPVVLSNGSGGSVVASVQGANVYLMPGVTEGAPETVGNLSVAVEGGTRVRLNWCGVADVAGYALYRRSSREMWGLLAELPANAQSYVDSGLEPGMGYSYRLASVNAVAESSSDPVSVTVPTQYRYWADVHIGLSLGEPSEDSDSDGIGNYLEYLMGSDPMSPESGLLRTGFEDMYGLGDDYFTMSFDVNDWALSSLSIDTTGSLTEGTWVTATEVENTANNGMRHLKFRSQWPTSVAPNQFIRVKASR